MLFYIIYSKINALKLPDIIYECFIYLYFSYQAKELHQMNATILTSHMYVCLKNKAFQFYR